MAGNSPEVDEAIPPGLIEEIRAGRCVAFIGSGFSGAAGLPTWETLLRELAGRPEAERIRPQIEDRLTEKTAHAFDEVAQALEDVIGRGELTQHLRQKLSCSNLTPEMHRRRQLVRQIPFRAVLTTNYDETLRGEVPGPSSYRQLLRSVRTPWIGTLYVSYKDRRERPLLKLHGDLKSPDTIVLTRRDYRRLLYEQPDYLNFLRAYLMSHAVLYLGFSFTDAYLNELRSEILTRLDQKTGSAPVGYAVINDVASLSREHFRKHEGIEILTYDTQGGKDYSGFDRILERIHSLTSPEMRYRTRLAGKRLLWVDPRWETTFQWAHDYFDMRHGQEVLDLVRTAEEALEHLARSTGDGRAYDLAVCFWGDDLPHDAREPLALELMREIRARGIRLPVIIFAEQHVFRNRKRQAIELGSLGCYYRWESLLRAIQMALDPESETT